MFGDRVITKDTYVVLQLAFWIMLFLLLLCLSEWTQRNTKQASKQAVINTETEAWACK